VSSAVFEEISPDERPRSLASLFPGSHTAVLKGQHHLAGTFSGGRGLQGGRVFRISAFHAALLAMQGRPDEKDEIWGVS